MNNVIEFKNIKKAYEDKVVISDFNLSIEKGEFVTIIGSSGCGKTTILKMINGLIESTSGDIFIDGETIKNKNLIELRRNIGYAIQGSVLFPHMTVKQNISYVPNLLNKKDKKKTEDAVYKWMKIVGLDEELKERYPFELSGGQQQRVCIARTIAMKPDVILMDEPTSALDPISTSKVEDLMATLKSKYTIVIVTHNMQQAGRIADKTAFFLSGEVIEYGKTEDIFYRPKDKRTEDYITGRFG